MASAQVVEHEPEAVERGQVGVEGDARVAAVAGGVDAGGGERQVDDVARRRPAAARRTTARASSSSARLLVVPRQLVDLDEPAVDRAVGGRSAARGPRRGHDLALAVAAHERRAPRRRRVTSGQQGPDVDEVGQRGRGTDPAAGRRRTGASTRRGPAAVTAPSPPRTRTSPAPLQPQPGVVEAAVERVEHDRRRRSPVPRRRTPRSTSAAPSAVRVGVRHPGRSTDVLMRPARVTGSRILDAMGVEIERKFLVDEPPGADVLGDGVRAAPGLPGRRGRRRDARPDRPGLGPADGQGRPGRRPHRGRGGRAARRGRGAVAAHRRPPAGEGPPPGRRPGRGRRGRPLRRASWPACGPSRWSSTSRTAAARVRAAGVVRAGS